MAVGAYAAYNFQLRVPGMPLLVRFVLGGLWRRWSASCSACRRLRIKGFYLAVATLAAQFFIAWA